MNDYSRVAEGLRTIPQWILWSSVQKATGLPAKVPTDANQKNCNPHDPKNWMSFGEAIRLQQRIYEQSGIQLYLGFVLTEADRIVCVDLDGCRDPITGVVAPWALFWVRLLQSYTEVSPSGTGLKIFVISTNSSYIRLSHQMTVERISEKDPKVEIFSAKQFMAVTGWVFEFDTVEDCTVDIDFIVSHYPSTTRPLSGSKSASVKLDFRDNRDADPLTIECARQFLESEPGAIQHEGGRIPTFRIACSLILNYELSTAQALERMEEWNTKCKPPWSTAELKQKLSSACRKPGPRGSRNMARMILEARALMESSKTSNVSFPSGRLSEDFVPFPVDVLPQPLRTFINAASASIGCDPSNVALPVIATCAAAIGNTRTLNLKPGWSVQSILWCVVVGESGTQKTPAFKAAQKPLLKRQTQLTKKFREEDAAFKAAQIDRKKNNGPSSTESANELTPPISERCLVSDTSIEGLVPILRDNPRGVLLARDEVSGWIASFDKYSPKSNAPADVAHWLSIYSGQSIIVDRKTGERTIFVPHPAVSICGGIQPGPLNKVIGSEHRENGFLARILFAFPPRRQRKWTEQSISHTVEAEYDGLISGLFSLQAQIIEQDFVSIAVGLSPEAAEIFKEYVNCNGSEQFRFTGELAAAWSKLEEIPARLALLIHCVRQVSGGNVEPLVCDAESMRIGVQLANWFKNETRRLYERMTESQELRNRRELCEWIAKEGGRVRGRDLIPYGKAKTIAEAESRLGDLVKTGYGNWEHSQNATGPKAQEFVLSSQIANSQSAGSA